MERPKSARFAKRPLQRPDVRWTGMVGLVLQLTVEQWRRWGIPSAVGLAFLSVTLLAVAARSDNPPDDAVGTIEGDAIALQGPMTVEVVHGQIKTVLRSGNDIRVKSGQARLDLVEGGKIAICGPAHLSVHRQVRRT